MAVTVRINPRDFKRGLKYAKAFGGRYDPTTKTWLIATRRPEMTMPASYGLIIVSQSLATDAALSMNVAETTDLEADLEW